MTSAMDTDQLLDLVADGKSSAAATLLTRHKGRLRRMVRLRLDPRLTARLDPSDVVQDALAEAHIRLPSYVKEREIPFYPWLRAIAWDKLIEMKRRHIHAERRSVLREVSQLDLSGDSQLILAEHLLAATDAPRDRVLRDEMRARVQRTISELPPRDHEVIVLRHLEELSFAETAAVVGVSEDAIYSRYRRALQRLHRLLNEEQP
jgi:RNA polymerase sigma-70 factor (ECF subfamily)